MDEPYRTMIGHMHHEIVHMLWYRFSPRDDFLDVFRAIFGDHGPVESILDTVPGGQENDSWREKIPVCFPHRRFRHGGGP
ncbi:putative zinc-binding metallopeptidase [Halomonas sp. YJPS3-2]|nr:putative zinc-binding metallopeptidase [Halomonas getboli]